MNGITYKTITVDIIIMIIIMIAVDTYNIGGMFTINVIFTAFLSGGAKVRGAHRATDRRETP